MWNIPYCKIAIKVFLLNEFRRHVADLGPFPRRDSQDFLLEGYGGRAADKEFDFFETFVVSAQAIGEKVMVVPRSIRSYANPFNSFRQIPDRLLENSEKIVIGRDVAVPELRMNDKFLLGPVDV